jgi:hypothetical protein
MGSNHNLITSAQAAEYLGTTRQVVYWYVRTGRLKRAGKEMGARGRVRHLYREEDVQLLLKRRQEKQPNRGAFDEAVIRATRAESMCRDVERRLDDLYEMLGLQYYPPDLSEDGLRAQHRNASTLASDGPPITPAEALELARQVYRMNEEQLRLIERLLSDPEPWGVYAKAIEKSLVEMRDRGEEGAAVSRYLTASARHLRHVAFEFVRAAYGHVRAEKIVEQSGTDIDESIAAILMSTARISHYP